MNGFTKALAAVNLLGALVSLALFAATWFAQSSDPGGGDAVDVSRKRPGFTLHHV